LQNTNFCIEKYFAISLQLNKILIKTLGPCVGGGGILVAGRKIANETRLRFTKFFFLEEFFIAKLPVND
jgi:hypothetical protein